MKIKILNKLCLCSFLWISTPLPITVAKTNLKKPRQTLFMEKGESLSLLSPAFERVWLSQAGVVSVQDTSQGILLQAKKEGEVLLNIGSRLYVIQVLNQETKKHMLTLKEFFSHRMGLKANFTQGHIRVQGRLLRVKDFQDLTQIAQDHKIPYLFSADVDKNLRPQVEHHILEQIKNPLFTAPLLSWQKPLTAFLPDNASLIDFYTPKLKPFGLVLKKDPSILSSPPLINLKILLIESKANHAFQTHINWGDKVISRLLSGDIFKNFISEFKAMENKGQARVLSETSLLSESGKKARFHSGGSVPIPHFNPESGTQSVRWKPYGIQLNFLAKTDQHKKIHIQTQVEISEVDHVYSAHVAPALKSSSITSSVTMQAGQSLLLSKMIRQQSGRSYSAPPPLFRLPAVGKALSFKGKVKEHTRLNIFITANLNPQTHKEKTHENTK